MKIRKGFVSNSSSSSFVVAFKELPKSKEELQKLLFGEAKVYGESRLSTLEVAGTVWEDLQDKQPLTNDQITDELCSGHIYELDDLYPDSLSIYHSNDFTERLEAYDKWQAKKHEVTTKYAEKFINELTDCKAYLFEYSDNDGSYFSALEHEGLFDNLPHIRISHH